MWHSKKGDLIFASALLFISPSSKKKCFQVKEEILAFMINYIYIYILASYFDSSMCLVDTASVVMCPENNRE